MEKGELKFYIWLIAESIARIMIGIATMIVISPYLRDWAVYVVWALLIWWAFSPLINARSFYRKSKVKKK